MTDNHSLGSWFMRLAMLVLFTNCREHKSPPLAVSSTASALPSAVSSSAVPPAASLVASAAPSKTVPRASKPIDRKAYASALNAGRVATRAGNYDDARAAFTRALAAFPDEPQALSERGYAELLAEDLKAAAADLGRARDLGPNTKLAAQIWFNLGLLAEKRADDGAARAAFARSLSLVPTGAAKKKLAARATCGAIIERRPDADEADMLAPRIVSAKSWLDAYAQLYADNDPKADPAPTTELEARQSFCTRNDQDRCTSNPPWVLSRYLNSAFGELEDHVYVEPNHSLLIYHAGVVQRMTDVTALNHIECLTTQTLEVKRTPDLLTVSTTTEYYDWRDASDGASGACNKGATELSDVIYDLKTKRELIRVTRPAGQGAAIVQVKERTVEISAGECSKSFSLDTP